MRIAFIITTLVGGGAERVASLLCNDWVNKGHDVSVILTSNYSYKETDFYRIDERIHLYTISENKKVKFRKKVWFTRDILVNNKVQCVITFLPNSAYISMQACKGLNIKQITSERNDPINYKLPLYLKVLKCITFNKADRIVFQTEKVKQMFDKKIIKKGIVITNPCNLELVKNKSNEIKKDNFVITSAGRLCSQKRFDFLIKSVSLLVSKYMRNNIIVNIYGNGELKDNLTKLIKENNLDEVVRLYPFTNNIHNLIKDSDLFIMTSKFEGFPNSLLEASIMGVPSIACDFNSGAAREIINDGKSGFIIPVEENNELLANKINEMMDNYDSFYNESLINRKSLLEKHNLSIIGDKWLKLIEDTVYE